MGRANVYAPFSFNCGVELFVVVFASPKITAEAAFPSGLFVFKATDASTKIVPALIVLVPEYELEPERVNAPVPFFVSDTVPEVF